MKRLVFAAILALVLPFMYNKMAAGLDFHEYTGLTLLLALLVHLLINFKWMLKTSKVIWKKLISGRFKLRYILNLLLLMLFFLVGISGLEISKVLFNFHPSNPGIWKMIHFSAAAYALIMVGIHLGLHYQFIVNNIKKLLPLSAAILKPIGLIFSVLVLIYGGYSLAATNFIGYLSFSSHDGGGQHHGGVWIKSGSLDSTSDLAWENGQHHGQPYFQRNGQGIGWGSKGEGFSTQIWATIASYFSIMFVFAALTRLADFLFSRRRKI